MHCIMFPAYCIHSLPLGWMLSITKWLCGWTLLGDNALNKAQVNEAGQAALHISRAWPISNTLQQNTAAREKGYSGGNG